MLRLHHRLLLAHKLCEGGEGGGHGVRRVAAGGGRRWGGQCWVLVVFGVGCGVIKPGWYLAHPGRPVAGWCVGGRTLFRCCFWHDDCSETEFPCAVIFKQMNYDVSI